MYQGIYTIDENIKIAPGVYKMTLLGDTASVENPGQFINIKIDGLFLRRPISISDWSEGKLEIIYKVVGKGTEKMAEMIKGDTLDILCGLGNGFDTSKADGACVVIGGGVGVPPMYGLAKKLIKEGKKVYAVLGFNKEEEIFYKDEFEKIGAETYVTTVDGSYGIKGFVTDALKDIEYTYFYTCGPEPMLKAVYNNPDVSGQLSFEERMGCGFGACMGCSCKTKYGNKRICKDGPVLEKEEIIW